jgi:DNA-binding response OmpR family regulator
LDTGRPRVTVMIMRVLLVEDSERLQRSLGTGLRKAGYALDLSSSGTDGLWRATTNDYDVVILDIMLPGIDGLSVLRKLRDAGRQTHVLLLTAKDTVEDRVTGLRAGADDYLVKPFAFDELLARIEALGRRQVGRKQTVTCVGDLELDPAARVVRRDGHVIPLLPREFALLKYLAKRAGEVVTRTDIEAHIYDDRAELMSNVVDSAICALRRKIDLPGQASMIVTRRRVGYVLAAHPG